MLAGVGAVSFVIVDASVPVHVTNDGVLTTAGRFDREASSSFKFVVIATSPTHPNKQDEAVVVVILIDINDNRPVFSRTQYFAVVPEELLVGSVMVTLSAADPDDGANGRLTYSFAPGSIDSKHFSIEGGTGVIRNTKQLDIDASNSQVVYSMVVEVRDEGTPTSLSATANVFLSLSDVNDHWPVFVTEDNKVISLAEDAAIGTVLSTVVARDNDASSAFSFVSYAITGGNEAGKFSINTKTGALRLRASLDYEDTTEYALTVTAADQGRPPNAAIMHMTVKVTNINDVGPSFAQPNMSVSIKENDFVSQVVFANPATDPDPPAGGISYSLITGGDLFVIDAATGSVSTEGGLDRESLASDDIVVTVVATDSELQLSATLKVTVTVLDINDNDPQFDISEDTLEVVTENAPLGTIVTTVGAFDPDSSDVVRFAFDSAASTGSSKFFIDSDTGEISVIGTIDYESETFYVLQVRAYNPDSNPARFATKRITIVIADQNDNVPAFESAKLVRQSPEDTVIGTVLFVSLATDPDFPVDAAESDEILTYTIEQLDTPIPFTINDQGEVREWLWLRHYIDMMLCCGMLACIEGGFVALWLRREWPQNNLAAW